MTRRATKALALILASLLVVALTSLMTLRGGVAGPPASAPRVADELLVRFRGDASPEQLAALNATSGTIPLGHIDDIDVWRFRLPAGTALDDALAAYRRNPLVEFAEPNYIATIADTIPNDPWFASWQWAVKKIQAPAAWDITTGSPAVLIAIVDTGIDATHSDLAGKVVPGYNFVAGNTNTADDHGHGTGVAGVAAAAANNGTGMAGVSWQSPLMPLKVCDASGSCAAAYVASGITWAADHGARVINVSLAGAYACPNTFQSAVDYAWNKGAVIVAAAGNEGAAAVDAPANCNHVIAAGATDINDTRTSWSNSGSALDVVAPGVGVTCTALSNSIGQCSGTSFSSPLTAGTAALLFAAGAASNSAVVSAITNGADGLGDPGWDPLYGWGRINAYRSLLSLTGGALPTPTPMAAPTSTPIATPTSLATAIPTSTSTSTPNATTAATATPTAMPTSTATPTPTPTSIDTVPPQVTLTYPGNGQTVRGTITISASASDNVAVARVAFFIDGRLFKTDSSSPFTVSWNTRQWANGTHTLTAQAVDIAGLAAADAHTVTIRN